MRKNRSRDRYRSTLGRTIMCANLWHRFVARLVLHRQDTIVHNTIPMTWLARLHRLLNATMERTLFNSLSGLRVSHNLVLLNSCLRFMATQDLLSSHTVRRTRRKRQNHIEMVENPLSLHRKMGTGIETDLIKDVHSSKWYLNRRPRLSQPHKNNNKLGTSTQQPRSKTCIPVKKVQENALHDSAKRRIPHRSKKRKVNLERSVRKGKSASREVPTKRMLLKSKIQEDHTRRANPANPKRQEGKNLRRRMESLMENPRRLSRSRQWIM
mmetsp:Transcript_5813/g.22061  ORF Transcript_5813/g.22061 Transcript_5813/m.22061 type:complete len:268 (-) Transcript_5813:433-1236(-)